LVARSATRFSVTPPQETSTRPAIAAPPVRMVACASPHFGGELASRRRWSASSGGACVPCCGGSGASVPPWPAWVVCVSAGYHRGRRDVGGRCWAVGSHVLDGLGRFAKDFSYIVDRVALHSRIKSRGSGATGGPANGKSDIRVWELVILDPPTEAGVEAVHAGGVL